ncbi:hypothetical protein THAOC_05835 [Thalassiosira oceanica]|uniref:Uncharacterized protein n=1 Tax=Thalassiosira oceanica TaxID=159749 RepID=K0TMD8_THAOC|nr:hypothetical protein THAOC_05835 [Thalassiosira oceanica]|eukprot:EJK72617.1 hypothetical protein THAOC_05835 [Thalassiosira oceanica]
MTELKSSSGVIPVVVAAYRPRSQGRAGFCGKVVQFPENQSKSESGWVTPCVPCSSSQPLKPPLPPVVKKVLSRCRLAYLSTVDSEIHSSHLSLMRFTYLPEEELIIMSTNRMTKKYDMISRQKGVALLIHDFADEGGADRLTGEFSISKCPRL